MSAKDLCEVSTAELLALPVRDWDEETVYRSLIIVPTPRKHDSGWRLMAIVGCATEGGEPKEIAAFCDDIEWTCHDAKRFGDNGQYAIGQIRTDCCWRSRALHMWSSHSEFKVWCSLSTTRIEVLQRERRPAVRPE